MVLQNVLREFQLVIFVDKEFHRRGPVNFRERRPYLALINRAGGLYGRILTEVVSTDRTQ